MLLGHVSIHSHKSGQVFFYFAIGSSLLMVNVTTLQLVSAYCHSFIAPINSTVVLGMLAGEWLQLLVSKSATQFVSGTTGRCEWL